VGVGKRPRALAIFIEQRGGLQNCQAGACSRAEAAEQALTDACPVKRGEEGKRGPFKNFDLAARYYYP
jgi:hypothetical protein